MQLSFTILVLAAAAVKAAPRKVYLPGSSNSVINIVDRRDDIKTLANKIIPVVVGGPQDTFVPNSVIADVGDVIQFQFSNGNHTVTQSAADSPCHPLVGGVNSGHIPFVDNQTTVGTFNMPVLSTDTMFMYCATGPHCQEGQVMVVNPNDVEQIVNYTKLAMAQTENIDSDIVVGGTIGTIDLSAAAFIPAEAEEQAEPIAGNGEAQVPIISEVVISTSAGTIATESAVTMTSGESSVETTTTAAAIITTESAVATVPGNSTTGEIGASTSIVPIVGNTAVATLVLSGTVTTSTTVTIDATASA